MEPGSTFAAPCSRCCSGRWRCSLSPPCSSRSAPRFGLANPLAIGATAATIAIALVIPVVWGGLQGAGQFRELSGATLLFAGTRLAVGLVIAVAGGSVGAIMLGIAVATALTALVSLLPLRGLLAHGGDVRLPRAPARDDPERGRRGRADGAHRARDDGPARREARVPERRGGRLRGRVRRARACCC